MLNKLDRSKAQIILNEYERRRISNRRYSKRAFSRDLGISHTLFSLIESGRRPVSVNLVNKILSDAKLPKQERDILSMGLPVDSNYATETISLEEFEKISNWQTYAILSLTEIADFEWCTKWIAARLNIKTTEARKHMRTLEDLGMIARDSSGRYVQTGKPMVVNNKMSSEATRKFNGELLEKAKNAMETLPFEVRELSSITFAMDPGFFSYASERISNFRRSLCKELENLGSKQEVYTLSIQLFPLTQIKGSK
jgi:transcriptional regulator with XRE-family HTH domain